MDMISGGPESNKGQPGGIDTFKIFWVDFRRLQKSWFQICPWMCCKTFSCVVLMPSFVNIGAYVDSEIMIVLGLLLDRVLKW